MREIALEQPVDEMDESDLRETFSEVMEAHNENVTEFEEVQERAEKADEFSERIDELEEDQELAVEYFAGKATEVTNISEEILTTRFSVDELVEMAGKYDEAQAEFAEESEDADVEGDEDEDEEDETIFADNEQQSPAFSNDDMDSRREAAADRLGTLGGIAVDE